MRLGRGARPQLQLAHSVPTTRATRRTTAVPTNEQRRATAKRKLERQLERRAQQARRRRLYTIIASAVTGSEVFGAAVGVGVITNRDSGSKTPAASSAQSTS